MPKGIEFASNSSLLSDSLEDRFMFSSFLMVILLHYVIFAHIVGGFLIAAGLLTRLACGVQIPILIGAIIFVNRSVTQHFSEFFLSLITLLLLCYFLIIGSGPWSLDRLMWSEEDRKVNP